MKYLFYISKLYSIPIVIPLVRYLEKKGDSFSFFISQKVNDNLPDEWKDYLCFLNIGDAIKWNPDFVLCPGNFVDFRLPGIKVQLFHGIGIEKPSHYQIRHFFDVYLTSGPCVTERFIQLQDRYKYFLVEETGWPKIDYILDYPASHLKKELGIPKEIRVILYAPTHSRSMQSADQLLSIIPKTIQKDEVWIMKFHEFMDVQIISKFMNEEIENVIFAHGYDVTPYLHVSDVLITDTSSVAYEFMVLDKPVITYCTSARFDKGINITEPNQLRDALDRSLSNPAELQKNRRKHLTEVNPNLDGGISRRIFETLEDIKINNRLAEKRKPLNLFRKAQVIYHSIFRKGYLR